MLKQIKIENFRCFKSFELQQLGRVNLLVGKNNSGKTSILEAIRLLCSNVDEELLKQMMINRGEYSLEEEFDFSHLFYKHEINLNEFIFISAINQNNEAQVKISVIKPPINLIIKENEIVDLAELIDKIRKSVAEKVTVLEYKKVEINEKLNNKPFSSGKILDSQPFVLDIQNNNERLKNKFVTSSSLTPHESLELFNQIVLTPEEDLVYEALQIIEPNIKRIAPIGNEIRNNNSRSGFYVLVSDTQKRVPIGSMGDGIWRMLGLILALVSVKDGVLLVDEIDTGLHYTALEDMWKLIWETAKKLNVQVFATTHSRDCYEALEVLANRDDVGEEDISIQRIEKDATKSVAYNKEEIAVAAEREIEVR